MPNTFYAKASTDELIVKLIFTNKLALSKFLSSNQEAGYKGLYTVEIEKEKSKRSLDQNAYLWGVVYRTIAESTGHTEQEIHEYLKRVCLPPQIAKIMGKEIKLPASTTNLDKGAFGEYIERIRAEVASLGISIPEATNKKEFVVEVAYPENDLGESKF